MSLQTEDENNKSQILEPEEDIISDPDMEDDLLEDQKRTESKEASEATIPEESTLDQQTESIKKTFESEKRIGKDLKPELKNDSNMALFFNRNKAGMIILGFFLILFLFFSVIYPMLTEHKVKKTKQTIENRGSVYIPDFPEETNKENNPVMEEHRNEEIQEPPKSEEDFEKKYPPPTAPVQREYTQPSSAPKSDVPATNRNEQQKTLQRMSMRDSYTDYSSFTGNNSNSGQFNEYGQYVQAGQNGVQTSIRTPTVRTGLSNPNVTGNYTPLSLSSVAKTLGSGAASSYQSQNNQDGKKSFMKENAGSISMQWNALNTIWKGTVINAVLDTGIKTDLPGQVMAHVTKNVYSSQNGEYLLIPQGSCLYGEYNSDVSYGQSQVQVVWNTLIRTDGLEINLGSMNGIDKYGVSGYKGFKTEHPFEYAKAMGLIAMFSILDTSVTKSINSTANTYSQNVMSDVYAQGKQLGNKIIDKALDIQPTIKIKSGTQVNLITNLTIDLPPMENIPVTEKYIRSKN